jgi:DnaK suppressor protein
MREQKIAEIRKTLLGRRQELLSEFRTRNAEAADLIDQGVPDVGDQGLTGSLQDLLHLLSDNAREEIIQIDDALDRINDASYGRCLRCNEPITIQRLEVRPQARHCIDCKEILEREESVKAPPDRGKL